MSEGVSQPVAQSQAQSSAQSSAQPQAQSQAQSMAQSRAWGWVRHLEAGGTTTWSDWRARGESAQPPATGVLPGAQHLELLRRLNLAAQTARQGAPDAALARRILTANAPGRGQPDLALLGVREPRGYGFDPVDPTALAPGELLRISTWLVAQDLHAGDRQPPPQPVRRRWGRTAGYRLLGDPLLVEPIRERLIARGLPPGTTRLRRGRVIVHGTDLATMLADLWSWRCFWPEAGPLGTWEQWVARVAAGPIPERIDLPRLAERWARTGRRLQAVVVLDRAALAAQLPSRLPAPLSGWRRRLHRADLPDVRRPSLTAAELARWIRPNLGLLPARTAAGRDAGELMTQVLLPRLIAADSGPPPRVPARLHPQVERRAARLAERLYGVSGPVRVLGDVSAVVPQRRPDQPASATNEDAVLALSLALLLSGESTPEGRSR